MTIDNSGNRVTGVWHAMQNWWECVETTRSIRGTTPRRCKSGVISANGGFSESAMTVAADASRLNRYIAVGLGAVRLIAAKILSFIEAI